MNKEKKVKKKKEYSKIITSFIIMIFVSIAVWSMYEYYILVRLAIELQSVNMPDATLPVTSITTILGAAMSYFIYQGYLKGSLNKHHLVKNEEGLIKAILDRETVEELLSSTIENEQIEEESPNNKNMIGFTDRKL